MTHKVLFVNGVSGPPSEISEIRNGLADIFEVPVEDVHHFDNTTCQKSQFDSLFQMMKDIYKELKKQCKRFGISTVVLVLVWLFAILLKPCKIAFARINQCMKQVKKFLHKEAKLRIKPLLSQIQQLGEASVERITLVCHSHGGWCAHALLKDAPSVSCLQQIAQKLHIITLGSPVCLPPQSNGEKISYTEFMHVHDPITVLDVFDDDVNVTEKDTKRVLLKKTVTTAEETLFTPHLIKTYLAEISSQIGHFRDSLKQNSS